MTTVTKTFPNRYGKNFSITQDLSRTDLLTPFGKATLKDRYLGSGENEQDLFSRVSAWFAKDADHAQRLYDYMSQLWFMPATPVLSNGGTDRGLPISCFLNAVPDTMEGIRDVWSENVDLASSGGGIGTYWGDVREIGSPIRDRGQTSGIIPFIKVMDSLTLAVSQGSLRRGSAAVYLDISHPEIEEFIDVRRQTGDPNRRSLNIHHGVNVSDAFMEAVRDNLDFGLISPKTGEVVKTVKARNLFIKLLTARLETGEPYMVFTDTVNRKTPALYKALGLRVKQSNLCSEIALHTGMDHLGNERTAVCCLSSVNVETYNQWKGNRQFLKDVMYFLDEVIQDFIDRTEGQHGFAHARYSAMRERSIGLGVMGYHSLLQQRHVAYGSDAARDLNLEIFGWFYETGEAINREAAGELGPNLDSLDAPEVTPVRWSNWSAIAPTASISIIAANASPCTEPWPANAFSQKTLSGTFLVKNRYLDQLLGHKFIEHGGEQSLEEWLDDQWVKIMEDKGSVANLSYLSDDDKAVFATAFEIGAEEVIYQAADRAPCITQMASVNIYVPANIDKKRLVKMHQDAWELGLPSLYYLRSLSLQRATNLAGEMPQALPQHSVTLKDNGPQYDECLACQ